MKKVTTLFVVLAIISLVLVSCAPKETATPEAAAETEATAVSARFSAHSAFSAVHSPKPSRPLRANRLTVRLRNSIGFLR